MIENIHYLVGPNGTGKTRALERLSTEHGGFLIPKVRAVSTNTTYGEGQTRKFIQQFAARSKQSSEQIAMSLLRENAKLRYDVFSILSQKLGRDFSVEVIERSANFKITSGLNDGLFEEVSIQRYSLDDESSGLRELLVLLTLVHSGLSKKYFIDEPELSLHPEAQRFLKNELLRLTEDKGYEFWLATHSPIFFSPESIDELNQAVFYSDPQKGEGNLPNFDSLTDGQKTHLDRSLLRLDTEKWMLVHSKAVIFCEGIRDKTIFKTVFRKVNIDLSLHDLTLIETGGKDDFSTLFILCKIIDKQAYFIGDLDCLINCTLMDKYDDNDIMKAELRGIASTILDYISGNIRQPLGELTDELLKLSDSEIQNRDTEDVLFPHISRIRKRTDNSKSLTLELISKYKDQTKAIISNRRFNKTIELLNDSTAKAIDILKKVGIFVIPTGDLETYYKTKPVSLNDEKEIMRLFNEELEVLNTDSGEVTKERYMSLIDFVNSILEDTFDKKEYMREELIKLLSRIQVIVLEDKPQDVEQLKNNSKYDALKVGDLIELSNISWTGKNFNLTGKSTNDFTPEFEIKLSSRKGITSAETINFGGD